MMLKNSSLSFDSRPALRQTASLIENASRLWQRTDVMAVWLGASFASGKADGPYIFSGWLMRLQFMLATGQGCGDVRFPPMTIQTITPVLQTLRAHYGDEVPQIIAQPVRTKAGNIAAV